MHITRLLKLTIEKRLPSGKAILLLGPRQVGKSTLLRQIVHAQELRVRHLDCDDTTIKMRLEIQNSPNLQHIIEDAELVLLTAY